MATDEILVLNELNGMCAFASSEDLSSPPSSPFRADDCFAKRPLPQLLLETPATPATLPSKTTQVAPTKPAKKRKRSPPKSQRKKKKTRISSDAAATTSPSASAAALALPSSDADTLMALYNDAPVDFAKMPPAEMYKRILTLTMRNSEAFRSEQRRENLKQRCEIVELRHDTERLCTRVTQLTEKLEMQEQPKHNNHSQKLARAAIIVTLRMLCSIYPGASASTIVKGHQSMPSITVDASDDFTRKEAGYVFVCWLFYVVGSFTHPFIYSQIS